jgi:predicted RNA-binding Zn-ribbon protein involved in translation (DUF1610 family)
MSARRSAREQTFTKSSGRNDEIRLKNPRLRVDLQCMTKIRATCPTCGNVEFGIESIVVLGHSAPSGMSTASFVVTSERGGAATYRFECPCCDQHVLRSAEREIIELLLSVGVPVEAPKHTIEKVAPEVATLPAFTLADVDRLRNALNEPGWLQHFQELDR